MLERHNSRRRHTTALKSGGGAAAAGSGSEAADEEAAPCEGESNAAGTLDGAQAGSAGSAPALWLEAALPGGAGAAFAGRTPASGARLVEPELRSLAALEGAELEHVLMDRHARWRARAGGRGGCAATLVRWCSSLRRAAVLAH
jgi:hypothetical protein